MNATAAGIPEAYSCSNRYYFVIGGDGLVTWRGSWNQTTIANEVQLAIDALPPTAVGDLPHRDFALGTNYPNPFNPSTVIPYDLREGSGSATVRLEVLDLRGRVVRTLVSESQERGRSYAANWDGRDAAGQRVASGFYMSRLTVDGDEQARIMTMVK
jgi:hypothetical protein